MVLGKQKFEKIKRDVKFSLPECDEECFWGYNNNAEKRYDYTKMLKRNLNLICAFFMIKWKIKTSLIVMLFKCFVTF